jgi:hypothetical protein
MHLEDMPVISTDLDKMNLEKIRAMPSHHLAISEDKKVIAMKRGPAIIILRKIEVGENKKEKNGYVREILMPSLQKAFGETRSVYIRTIKGGEGIEAAGGHYHTDFSEIMTVVGSDVIIKLAYDERTYNLDLSERTISFKENKFTQAVWIPSGVAHQIELENPEKGDASMVVIANGRHTPGNTINYEFV